jgi:hypothetical protein
MFPVEQDVSIPPSYGIFSLVLLNHNCMLQTGHEGSFPLKKIFHRKKTDFQKLIMKIFNFKIFFPPKLLQTFYILHFKFTKIFFLQKIFLSVVRRLKILAIYIQTGVHIIYIQEYRVS